MLSSADALAKSAFENVEATMRKQIILFSRFVARIGYKRRSKRMMFGEVVVGKGYSGGQ